MRFRFYCFLNVIILCLVNGRIVTERSYNRISSLLFSILRYLLKNFVAGKVEILYESFNELPIRILASVLHIVLTHHDLPLELDRKLCLHLIIELLAVVNFYLFATEFCIALGQR